MVRAIEKSRDDEQKKKKPRPEDFSWEYTDYIGSLIKLRPVLYGGGIHLIG